MFVCLFVALCLVHASAAADCTSPQGKRCLKKSEMPSGFGPMMLGGDPCFVYNTQRVMEMF